MRHLNFRGDGEEHNFWQNYTDLMSGFLIVFIIASLVAYSSYKVYVDLYHDKGITEANINDIVVNAELYKKIKDFQDAQKSLNRNYFTYNAKYKRFECTVDVLFKPEDPVIPVQNYDALIKAGKELEEILKSFKDAANVKFKIVIEGRAAKRLGTVPSAASSRYAETLSYNRARNLYLLWMSHGILKDVSKMGGELFIAGSGYGGQGRYEGGGKNGEDKNKTFIIQIIPYINY